MLEIIIQAIKDSECKHNVYFINADPVNDIPGEAVKNNIVTFNSSSSLMMEAFREVNH